LIAAVLVSGLNFTVDPYLLFDRPRIAAQRRLPAAKRTKG
jgi:hypothetical protein